MDKFALILLIAVIAVTTAFVIWFVCMAIIFANNKLYCKCFCKKEWDLWEKVIEKLKEQDGIILVQKYSDYPHLDSFHIDIEIDSEKYELVYWVETRSVSVHQGTKCILCDFDRYHSDMAVEIMKEKIKKAFDGADEETKRTAGELMGEW